MSKINQLRFEAGDACSCHRAATATVDGAPVRIAEDGGGYCVMAINDDGAMIAHPKIPDGIAYLSAEDLELLVD